MENVSHEGSRWFLPCLALLLAATLLINLLSAYIRLDEAGVGCLPWPECYARVGSLIEPPGETPAAALTPTDAAKQAHRGIATALVILVALVVYQARQVKLTGTVRHLPLAIVATVLILSVVGPASYLKTLPAIATVNIAGGLALLVMSWWLWLGVRNPLPEQTGPARRWVLATLGLVSLQFLLGAWTSANFAAAVCTGLFDCGNRIVPAESSAFWYFRELELDQTGRIVMDRAQVWIQQAHHLGAMVSAAVIMMLSLRCLRTGGRVALWGAILFALLVLQFGVGLGMLVERFPLSLVLSHTLLASLLILTLTRLAFVTEIANETHRTGASLEN